jgi:hypothetical protein
MPKGEEFSVDLKTIFFRIIDFVDKEKDGPIIPLNSSTARIVAMLGISERSVVRLKKELADQLKKHEEEANQKAAGPRTRTQSAMSPSPSHRKRRYSSVRPSVPLLNLPPPVPAHKNGNCGRKRIVLSDAADDAIRYHFHLLLVRYCFFLDYAHCSLSLSLSLSLVVKAEKRYPTVAELLASIHDEHHDFPITSEMTLWQHMKRLGFSYKQTSKVALPLDSVSFVAQRAVYFRRLDELRDAGAHIYFHDETWCNVGEEKRCVWLDEAGEGRIKKHDGKGKRLAISAMINETGFHKESVDMFTCDADHSMVSFFNCSHRRVRNRWSYNLLVDNSQ